MALFSRGIDYILAAHKCVLLSFSLDCTLHEWVHLFHLSQCISSWVISGHVGKSFLNWNDREPVDHTLQTKHWQKYFSFVSHFIVKTAFSFYHPFRRNPLSYIVSPIHTHSSINLQFLVVQLMSEGQWHRMNELEFLLILVNLCHISK